MRQTSKACWFAALTIAFARLDGNRAGPPSLLATPLGCATQQAYSAALPTRYLFSGPLDAPLFPLKSKLDHYSSRVLTSLITATGRFLMSLCSKLSSAPRAGASLDTGGSMQSSFCAISGPPCEVNDFHETLTPNSLLTCTPPTSGYFLPFGTGKCSDSSAYHGSAFWKESMVHRCTAPRHSVPLGLPAGFGSVPSPSKIGEEVIPAEKCN